MFLFFQKTKKTETLANLGAHMLTFDSTAQDLKYRSSLENISAGKKEAFFFFTVFLQIQIKYLYHFKFLSLW